MYMSELRRFLPYVVEIGRPPCDAPAYPPGRRLHWAAVVCDRRYNLLFATWLERKPTRGQVAAFACNAGMEGVNWGDDGAGTGCTTTGVSQQQAQPTGEVRCLETISYPVERS